MVLCQNVFKEFKAGTSFVAVNNVSLHVKTGEFVSIIGKSGSGKSTLLNLIGLIDKPTSGNIFIDGIDSSNMVESQLARIRCEKLGYIFQSFYLDHNYSVYKNVEIPLLIANMPSNKRRERVETCLEQVGMLNKLHSKTSTLSGGEKQRVCIARALANNPSLLLADEPCGNLDSENTQVIMEIFQVLNQKGVTIIMVTHDIEDAKKANRIITMKDGKIISDEN
ncbi:ABC transporter ATP-binding protein [Acetivibrio clariflavus]|uniref:ABC-type antimicrobial peptide transport system, ATPase component n=1 Tax=Acetivibrio clariflavus (strain DSM 19732 / NBRC 101661 / EBR45) TaxID=720554 RepID=G8LVR5_ACECE|nr:ABC transporter ATP-binding protein [Acetivibrio clariflavus]AEV69701.1 ABC-type antimicrobial peptide transport system, ATPase component [Acetivibrio clariflavus DSM 19732]